MSGIDRMLQLHRLHRDLSQGKAMHRLPLASGYSADHGVWELAVVEYLAEKIGSEDFIEAMLRSEQRREPLHSRYIRRQIELTIGLTVTVLPCPVRIDAQHIEARRSTEGFNG